MPIPNPTLALHLMRACTTSQEEHDAIEKLSQHIKSSIEQSIEEYHSPSGQHQRDPRVDRRINLMLIGFIEQCHKDKATNPFLYPSRADMTLCQKISSLFCCHIEPIKFDRGKLDILTEHGQTNAAKMAYNQLLEQLSTTTLEASNTRNPLTK